MISSLLKYLNIIIKGLYKRYKTVNKKVGKEIVFPGGSVTKNLRAKQEKRVQSLSREDPLEKKTAPAFFLGNPMDRKGWWTAVYEVPKSWTRPSTHKHTMSAISIFFFTFHPISEFYRRKYKLLSKR